VGAGGGDVSGIACPGAFWVGCVLSPGVTPCLGALSAGGRFLFSSKKIRTTVRIAGPTTAGETCMVALGAIDGGPDPVPGEKFTGHRAFRPDARPRLPLLAQPVYGVTGKPGR
jgi:hypothetical protein